MKYTWNKTGIGIVDNLGLQLQKVVRKMNENKLSTRYRYIEANERFINYLGKEFKLNKLSNIKDKHVELYVRNLKNNGVSDHYIKVELSAIRFIHNEMGNAAKHELSDSTGFNKKMGLGTSKDGRIDRAWEEPEIEKFKKLASEKGDDSIRDVLEAVRSLGLRLDEVCTLKNKDLQEALKTGKLHLKNTKGGRERDVPISSRARNVIEKKIENKESKTYSFVPKEYVEAKKIHLFEKKIQNFIYNNRDKIQNSDRSRSAHNVATDEKGALTMHGLRHSYAREEYLKRIEAGYEKDDARMEVAKLLGHGRDSVTFIYLGGIE